MKKKIIIEVFLIILILFLIFTTIIMINIPLAKYLDSKKNDFINEFRTLTGYELNYKKISPNILGKLKVFEVVLYNPDGTRLILGDIEVSYSLISFLQNNSSFINMINKIRLRSLDLRFNTEGDLDDLKKIINDNKNKNKNKAIQNIKNLTIEIVNSKINIINKKNEYLITANNLKVKIKDNINVFANIDIKINNKNEEIFSTSIKTKGNLKNDAELLPTVFNIDLYNTNYKNNQFIIQKFFFESSGKNFTFKRLEDKLPIKLIIKRENDNYYTDINFDNLSVIDLFKTGKKSFIFPDYLTFKSDLKIKNDFSKKEGSVISNVHYDKLLFLKNFNFNFDLDIMNNKININNFIINNITKDNYLNINGFIPFDKSDFNVVISIKDFLLPFTKINTEINITKSNNEINILSNNLILNNDIIDKFNFVFLLDKEKTILQTRDSFIGFTLDGVIQKDNIELNNNFYNFSIGKIINAYNTNFIKNISLNALLPLKYVSGKVYLEKSKFIITNDDMELSSFDIKFEKNLLSLEKLIINNEKSAEINGWLNFNKKPYISNIKYENNNVNLDIITKLSKIITISINDNLRISMDPNSNTLQFTAEDFNLPLKNNYTRLSFNFIYDLSRQIIYKNTIYIKNLNIFKEKIGILTASLSLSDNELFLNNILYKDNLNKIEGSVAGILNQNGSLIKGNGFLKDKAKDESYSLEYNITKESISAKMFLTHFDLNKIITNNKLSGFLNARINLSGTLKKPVIDIESDVSNGKINKNDFNSFISIQKNNEAILIKNGNIQIANNRISVKKSKITLNNNSKVIDINGAIYLDALQKIFKTNFTIQGRVDSIPDLKNKINIDLSLEKMTLGILKGFDLDKVEKYDDIKINLKSENDKLILTNYGDRFIYAERNNNNLNVKLFDSKNEFFDGNINISNDKKLTGKLNFLDFPANIIQKILLPFVGIDDGRIKGSIDLKGKLLNPEFYGNLSVIFGVVSLPEFLPNSIENITGLIIAEKNKFLVKNVNARVKKGLGHGYGEIVFNGWKLERYEFHMNSDLIPAVINKGPVDAKGIGYIKDFIIEGKPQNFNFIGDFVIDNADINLESLLGINKEKKIRQIPINVFINFTAGDRVKITHPLISGTIAPNEKFNIKFIGNEAHVYLGGKFKLKKGEVNYINRVFKIESAEFQFYDDEIKINPNINLKAYYRTKDTKRDTVTVYMNMNDRLIPFNTNFNTIPYKSQDEISALLGLPLATLAKNEETNSNSNNLNLNDESNLSSVADTTDYLSNSIIFTPFENKVRKVTGLDTFSLNTKFFGNIIKSNVQDNNNTLDLLDESSVTLGKYLFNELYFESIMSFNKRKDYGDKFFLPLSNQNYGLNLQLMLQLELPYISIGYSFLPKDYFNIINADHLISLEANFKL